MTLRRHHQAARFRGEIRPPSEEDVKQAEIMGAVGKSIVAVLRPILEANRDRFLRTLQQHELDAVAVAAISAYIATRLAIEERDASASAPLAPMAA